MTVPFKRTMSIAPIHPFPARMAPEIVAHAISELEPGSVVVDPMCGSGLVLREAVQRGHTAIGFDVDPLAILMSRVWTQPLNADDVLARGKSIVVAASQIRSYDVNLPWIDNDRETSKYIDFWFATRQQKKLRKLAHLIAGKRGPTYQALQLAISRIIITKKVGASLAWDVSHSRPHRVRVDNDFDVLTGFETAVSRIAGEIRNIPANSDATVRIGNAKKLSRIPDGYADAVITSPPYFNAIDYIRGHRLALVWLGYRVARLRRIRSSSIGREKALSERRFNNIGLNNDDFPDDLDDLTKSRLRTYVFDMTKVIQEVLRVLRPKGRLVLVVASSNIRGQRVNNPGLIRSIGQHLGLREINSVEREIPTNRRYLPPPTSTHEESLRKRMRTETVLTFEK